MIEINQTELSKYPVNGYYGEYGGQFVPEILIPALTELENAFLKLIESDNFLHDLSEYNKEFGGRKTPLYHAKRLSSLIEGGSIYLKREDLLHGGAHKLNNVVGQGLLTKYLGKKRIIAETGAGQHGVATAIIGAALGLETIIYMGEVDIARQRSNVEKMRLYGAKVIPVNTGSRTLKDAINEALRDWVTNVETTHYLIGSVVGPHPFPLIVRYFQSIIGQETKHQILTKTERLPDRIYACVGGGSNAAGMFYPFIDDLEVELVGIEAGGTGPGLGMHCTTLQRGSPGILHGSKSYTIQDPNGQIMPTHSISAGLDYPGVGPEHSLWKSTGRVRYEEISDNEAIDAFKLLSKIEGIIPALETSHALACAIKEVQLIGNDCNIVINLSGRGDKDIAQLRQRGLL